MHQAEVQASITAWPAEQRPRERLIEYGAQALSEVELVAVLLGTGQGRGGGNAVDLAREVLTHVTDIQGLARAGFGELVGVPGMGPVKAARLFAAVEIGARLGAPAVGERRQFLCSQDVFSAYGTRLAALSREVFIAILLDVRNRRLREVRVSEGGLSGTLVHPREVFGPAIREAAATVICLHNHPSGDPSPSQADIDLTHRLQEAGELVGIPLLDHVVVGVGRYVSLADQGYLGKQRAWQPRRSPESVQSSQR